MNTTGDLTHAIAEYRLIEELYRGSRTLVYRAIREADQHPVVIKLLHRDYPSFSELLQFRNQYTIAKNLSLPGVVAAYNLEFYRNSYALVMEDFGGVSLRQYTQKRDAAEHATRSLPALRVAQSLTVTEVLEIALQLADILYELYRHRVIHKDIKPANILIHPETKKIKLIDFSIASLLPRETQEIQNPNVLEGTLAYISPEQTGRMNRGIDYRTDFYSLGVTLYELLTGQLPFDCEDPMELVHCHIAKMPPRLGNTEEIPLVISDLVMKLMAKNAEDRYQSALGLKYDLEQCLQQWQESGKIEHFKLGQHDISDRFLIPEKLYGRQIEVETLLTAFDRISQGSREIMLVAGFSGIGKTAVVNEVHKPIVQQRGYFIKGKFDQFQRNIPFSAFLQAFRDLMGQMLSETDAQLEQWKSKILSALGENGQVIIQVIPELEQIIGQQPPVSELSGNAAQNRFNLLLQKFIQVFTTPDHPLVIFLDDLQWADSASLKLMQLLMSDTKTGYLLLIGAYRDNEVSPAHLMTLTLNEIGKTDAIVNTITLKPLIQVDLNHLVAEALNCTEDLAAPLTKLVYQKTKGNPFFATQFLKALHEEGWITFNSDLGYWQCDIAQIRALALTDDVVEFMALQLQKLPQNAQEVLKLAACIGNQFDLSTLAIVHEKSQAETAKDLWKVLQEGLILPTSEVYKFFQEDAEVKKQNSSDSWFLAPDFCSYRFLHDRVQQASYSLIPTERREATHLKIGQLLLRNSSIEERNNQIFEIVNQLNIGIGLINHQSERYELAQLNLLAGQKAKASTAHVAALNYLNTGMKLLETDSWHSQYDLTLAMYEEAVEAAYLSSNFAQMEQWIEVVLQQSPALLDTIEVYNVKMQACMAQNQLLEAIQTGLQVLQLLGLEFPKDPQLSDVQIKLEATLSALAGSSPIDLIGLPEMTDPYKQAAMKILSSLAPCAYQAAPLLLPLIVLQQVNLSIQYGNTALSAPSYAYFGLIICGVVGDIETGYQFGQLALSLLDRLNAKNIKARTIFIANANIRHWREPVQKTLEPLQSAYAIGLETGDLEFAALSTYIYAYHAYLGGSELLVLEREITSYNAALVQIKQKNALNFNQILHQAILNLIERTEQPSRLVGNVYDEQNMLPMHQQANDASAIFYVYFNKLILCYLFGQFFEAIENAAAAEAYLRGVTANFVVGVFYFYDSLTQLAVLADASESESSSILEKIRSNVEKIQKWAHYAPKNYQHKLDLIYAEQHRVLGNKAEAIDCYDLAIAGAKENGYLNEAAIANELAAKFYLNWNKEKIAQPYMQEAYYGYARWGAKAKINDLEKRYPQLLKPILQQRELNLNPLESVATLHRNSVSLSTHTSTSTTSISDVLDFASVLKAAQVISSSIEFDELIASLTRILLQNSGAEKSVLILPQKDTWHVRAITSIRQEANSSAYIQAILEPQPLETCQDIPQNIIHYVKNTQQKIVIDNLQTNIPGLIEEYMLIHQPQSVFCLPILNQKNLVGIIYLENKLTKGVFTNERLQVINLLASQVAISLENARLYQQAQQALQDLQQAQLQIVQSEKMSALGNLVAGVAHEINNPVGFIAGNLQPAKDYIKDLLGLIDLYQQEYNNPSEIIEKEIEAIDLEYLQEDLPKLIDSMKLGVERICSISTSLRTFSRADKDYKVPFNIHEGIDSTILILKHRLKANDDHPAIEVVKEYGNLLPVDCFPGQLNQVFMNILANAIDALEESNQGSSFAEIQSQPNCITIRTEMKENQWAIIRIADNGVGMTQEVKQHIFDHLFTTKMVGKGTGLGLAIAHQIVTQKHGGTIEVNSVPSQGTEFAIVLPVKG
jgi:predicted ATPase/signal transduction histidine kinase/tRNA A-37 threonylcarbamoyl transferase component Bud32